MSLKNKYRVLRKTGMFFLLLFAGFAGYVIFINRNTPHMTVRQKILNAVYPLIILFQKASGANAPSLANTAISPHTSFYDLPATGIDGKPLKLADFKGKKIMLVNTASDCGYTRQYKDLEMLYRDHRNSLIILAFPSNDFKQQEKGSNETIASFCKANFDISFPILQKSKVVKGAGQNEVYQWLTDKNKNGWNEQAPTWNFCKYLIDEQGKLIHFFASPVEPLSNEILTAVE